MDTAEEYLREYNPVICLPPLLRSLQMSSWHDRLADWQTDRAYFWPFEVYLRRPPSSLPCRTPGRRSLCSTSRSPFYVEHSTMNYHIADELETLVSCAIFLLSLYIMSAEMVCCCCWCSPSLPFTRPPSILEMCRGSSRQFLKLVLAQISLWEKMLLKCKEWSGGRVLLLIQSQHLKS